MKNWYNRLIGQEENLSSAEIAKQRLTVLVASNDHRLRANLNKDRIDKMKFEILDVVAKYVAGVNLADIEITQRKEDSMDVLEMSISLPEK